MKYFLVGIIVFLMVLFCMADNTFGESRTVESLYANFDERIFRIRFEYDDAYPVYPDSPSTTVPHYKAVVTVFEVSSVGVTQVGIPFIGYYTAGKCWEDDLATLVGLAPLLQYAEQP